MGKQAGNPLEAHLRGRGTQRGPMSGGYFMVTHSGHDLANSEVSIFRFPMLAAARMQASAVFANVTTSDPTYSVSNGVAGGTDLIAARNMPASDVVERIDAASSPVLANRDFAIDDVLELTLTADAGDALVDYSWTMVGEFTGHVQASQDND